MNNPAAGSALSQSLPQPEALLIERLSGLGDVLMVLAAAKALKTMTGHQIVVLTSPSMRSVAEACPYVDEVIIASENGQTPVAHYAGKITRMNVSAAAFGISHLHQVDAYLEAFGIKAPPELKEINLEIGNAAEAEAERLLATWPPLPPGAARILIHPGQSDPNRTWPAQQWQELASSLIARGHQVIAVGHNSSIPGRGAQAPDVPGLLDAIDRLNVLATIALMRKSHVLISADAGPIQMAGASDIGIVGLYSVAAGANRLPFRHGEQGWRAIAVEPACPAFPCYQKLHDQNSLTNFQNAIAPEILTPATLFAKWCVVEDRYHCMQHDITVAHVLKACEALFA